MPFDLQHQSGPDEARHVLVGGGRHVGSVDVRRRVAACSAEILCAAQPAGC